MKEFTYNDAVGVACKTFSKVHMDSSKSVCVDNEAITVEVLTDDPRYIAEIENKIGSGYAIVFDPNLGLEPVGLCNYGDLIGIGFEEFELAELGALVKGAYTIEKIGPFLELDIGYEYNPMSQDLDL